MSANAASLRRILRSIGSHAAPTTNALSASSKRTLHTKTDAPHSSQITAAETASNNAPDASSQQSSEPRSVVRKIDYTPRGSADDFKPAVKDGSAFHKRYFEAQKSDANHRMKQRARRNRLSKQRSEIPENQAWKDILRMLEQESPAAAEQYTKRMETIRLPEGIFAKWIRDPGESILEVMQRTGSHVQVKPTKEIGLFSSITLLGTPSQNAAAKKLLQESDLLSAVSEDDLNASNSLADYHLRSEIGGPVGRLDSPKNGMKSLDDASDDPLDSMDLAELEDVVSATTNDRTRAVWSRPAPASNRDSLRLRGLNGQIVIGTSNSDIPQSAVAFTAHVEQLTTDRPRRLWLINRYASKDAGVPLKDELVALMTNPDYAHLITPTATSMALRYLAKHMFFPAIRDVLNALKDVKRQMNADLFNTLLDAAAKNENVVAFHYIVNTMRERSVSPNAGTWIAFHTLMLKRFPDDADKVVTKMRANAVQADPSVAIENIEAYSSRLLSSFMKENPNASIKDFVENIKRDMRGIKWLTTFSANTMCHMLLKRGQTKPAFEVVDELVRHGGRPDAVTLNTFLTAAKKDGNISMAISILRKLHDLHANSIALSSSSPNPITLPRAHDLSITPNSNTFNLLFNLAWDRQYFNCTRVFWRYACCAGHADSARALSMTTSVTSKGANKGFAILEDAPVVPRKEMWMAWAGKFAMGAKAGLGPAQAAEVLRIVSPAIDVPADSPALQDGNSDAKPTAPLSRRAVAYFRRKLIETDQNEARSLRPVRSLADIAEEAWQKDRQWRDVSLGSPKGLEKYGDGDAMFDLMMKEAIEVPVEVGDGVGMKL
jgi:pentatricopeptide repeat protein